MSVETTSKVVVKTESEESTKVKEKSSSPEVPLEGVKHPLENAWCFWMFTCDKKNWEENLVKLTTFDTVEDYWCLYHYMKFPSELAVGQDYSIFKKGISPMWEHAANKKGGRWLISLEKRRHDMDWMWLDVVLLLIGENFENNKQICGVTVNVRAKSKISVWTSSSTNRRANLEIGAKLKEKLGHPNIIYQVHDSNRTLYSA